MMQRGQAHKFEVTFWGDFEHSIMKGKFYFKRYREQRPYKNHNRAENGLKTDECLKDRSGARAPAGLMNWIQSWVTVVVRLSAELTCSQEGSGRPLTAGASALGSPLAAVGVPVAPADSYVGILTSRVMVFGGRAFGGFQVLEVGPPWWGQCPGRGARGSRVPPDTRSHGEKTASEPDAGSHRPQHVPMPSPRPLGLRGHEAVSVVREPRRGSGVLALGVSSSERQVFIHLLTVRLSGFNSAGRARTPSAEPCDQGCGTGPRLHAAGGGLSRETPGRLSDSLPCP